MKEKMVVKIKEKKFTVAQAKAIGDKLAIDWETVDVKEFCLGLNSELAAGAYNPVTNFASNDPILIGKVVRAHLTKIPDYYTHWAQREKEAELEQSSKRVNTRSPTTTKAG
jgi:hypothetical protein